MAEANLVKVEYERPELPAVTAKSLAELVEIDDQTTYEIADLRLAEVKSKWKQIEAQRKAMVDPINKAKDAVQAFFNPVLADLAGAESVIKGKMLTYTREQERKQREQQAENDRLAREERERLEREAAKAEKKGNVERAEVLHATAAIIQAPVATSTVLQPKGSSIRTVWKGRITDRVELLKALIESPSFIDTVLEFKEGGINRLAQTLNGNVPLKGIQCYEDNSISKRVA